MQDPGVYLRLRLPGKSGEFRSKERTKSYRHEEIDKLLIL